MLVEDLEDFAVFESCSCSISNLSSFPQTCKKKSSSGLNAAFENSRKINNLGQKSPVSGLHIQDVFLHEKVFMTRCLLSPVSLYL